jgi:hypothetical protein
MSFQVGELLFDTKLFLDNSHGFAALVAACSLRLIRFAAFDRLQSQLENRDLLIDALIKLVPLVQNA